MKDDKLKTEALQLSIYCNIICNLLITHKNLSLVKTIVFSYIVKHEHIVSNNCFTANNTKELVFKSLSLLAGNYKSFCENVPYIIKSLDLLIKNGIIDFSDEILKFVGECYKIEKIYIESNFLRKAIDDSYTMTDIQFIKEVIYNV